jgi:hypothetical protein
MRFSRRLLLQGFDGDAGELPRSVDAQRVLELDHELIAGVDRVSPGARLDLEGQPVATCMAGLERCIRVDACPAGGAFDTGGSRTCSGADDRLARDQNLLGPGLRWGPGPLSPTPVAMATPDPSRLWS